MKKVHRTGVLFLFGVVAAATFKTTSQAQTAWQPELRLIGSINLPGSVVSPQMVYADNERIFVASAQGDLFILERDRQANFPMIQTIHFGAALTAVRGNKSKLFVTSQDGNLYVFLKTWPVQFEQYMTLSSYGLSALQVTGNTVYVAKGQASMIATADRIYLSALNPGDVVLELPSLRSYGREFAPGSMVAFDRQTQQSVGAISDLGMRPVNVSAWQNLVFVTNPGSGLGIGVYDAKTYSPVQFISRATNTVAGTMRKGVPLLIGGSETGVMDLYKRADEGYTLVSSADLAAQTESTGLEDVEIRALWVDGRDNLVFAASSWGNDWSRNSNLPSFFILEIR
jgi:hypothetical protein